VAAFRGDDLGLLLADCLYMPKLGNKYGRTLPLCIIMVLASEADAVGCRVPSVVVQSVYSNDSLQCVHIDICQNTAVKIYFSSLLRNQA